MTRKKSLIDDGFCSYLVEGATFDGIFEIPHIDAPKEIKLPQRIVPFTKVNKGNPSKDAIGFFEFDPTFADIIKAPQNHLILLKQYYCVLSLDCSLYRDMPFAGQIANTYKNRAICYYLRKHGIYTLPLIRWGDERSYTRIQHSECLAFQGVEKNSIYAVSSYGCIKSKEDKYHFRAGLDALMEELEPKIILAYGSNNPKIYAAYERYVKIIHYPDWTSIQKGCDK